MHRYEAGFIADVSARALNASIGAELVSLQLAAPVRRSTKSPAYRMLCGHFSENLKGKHQ
jgi:hypothetical protein